SKFQVQLPNPNQSNSVGVRGTIGYIAPEYGFGSDVSTDGDVYSYGILLLEMMTAKKPTDKIFQGGLNLHDFARMAAPENIADIVDPLLLTEVEHNETGQKSEQCPMQQCLISIIKVGVACSMESPQDRMDISKVVTELLRIKEILNQN
ncbi:hypothetical protein Tsubulata_022716, partial [Turnera subulata]